MQKICHIVGGGDFYPEFFCPSENDLVIAADAGFDFLKKIGKEPDITIGDFDSLGFIPNVNKIVLPVAKDDTDTGYAAKWAYDKNFRHFEFHGCTGGRIDHTLANIQTAAMLSRLKCSVCIHDKDVNYYAITNSSIRFDKDCVGTVSVFAHGGPAIVSILGLKYELDNAVLDPFFPLGVSNAFDGQTSVITAHVGTVLIVAPSDTLGRIVL